MKTEIQIFKNEQFGEIRTMVDEKGEPWFVGTDVAKMLGYNQSDKAILRHTDEDDRMKCTVTDNLGRGQSTFIINESSLIFDDWTISRLDDRRWSEDEDLKVKR